MNQNNLEQEWQVDFELEISPQARSKNKKGKYANSLYQHRWEGYLSACRKRQEERNICSCNPIPNIDWCENCTWKEVHLECDKNEKLIEGFK